MPARTDTPLGLLREDQDVVKKDAARRNNIDAARVLCELVRTSLGPRGMDKMLVSREGVIMVTNDGATMLDKIDIEHPAAKILRDLSKGTDKSVGDGTTSAVVLAGALLERADALIRKGIHPVAVVSGFTAAANHAIELLERGSIKVGRDRETITAIARTTLQSKIVANAATVLAPMVADAVLNVVEDHPWGNWVNLKFVKVEYKQGGELKDSRFIHGIMIDQHVAHPDMPRRIEKAKIAILTMPFKVHDDTLQKRITIRDADQIGRFMEAEVAMMKKMVEHVKSAGANLVICQKDMDPVALQELSRAGIIAAPKAYEYEIPKISRATGAMIVNSVEDLEAGDLGEAELVEEREMDGKKYLFIEGCKEPKAVTILVRAGTSRVVEEAERSVHDALMAAKAIVEEPALVVGGGATEAELAYRVARWATELEGRQQLAAEMFAEALEQIPVTLAQNAGMHEVDAVVALRAKHAEGGAWYGISADGKVKDMKAEGVLEPLRVKRHVIKSANEAVSTILRIDHIIAMRPVHQDDMFPRSGMQRPKELDAPLPT